MTPDPAPSPVAGPRRRPAPEWLHLIYLGILCFQPAFDPTSGPGDWVVVAAAAALFVPVYAVGELRPARTGRWMPLVTVALALAVAPFNTGAGVFLVYAAAFIGSSEPRPVVLRSLPALTALLLGVLALSPAPLPYTLASVLPSAVFIWYVGLMTLADADKDREATTLRIDNARVEHLATVAERERIARDLHDLLGHSLTGVVLRAQLAQRLAATDPQRAATEVAEIERTAREALAEVRAAVGGWRQASLDAELETARAALAVVGVEVRVRRDPELVLVPSTENAMALALREAATNVARHAGARHCRVDIGLHDGQVRLVVHDDGVGAAGPEGNGLTGLRERIAALGGRVDRSGTRGTTVTVAVPVRVAT